MTRSTEEVIRLGAAVDSFIKSDAGVAALASMKLTVYEDFLKAATLEDFRRVQARGLNLEGFAVELQRLRDDKDFSIARIARLQKPE